MHCWEGGSGWAATQLCAVGWGSSWPRAISGGQPNSWGPPSFREQINSRAGANGHLHGKLQRAGVVSCQALTEFQPRIPGRTVLVGLPHAKAGRTERCGRTNLDRVKRGCGGRRGPGVPGAPEAAARLQDQLMMLPACPPLPASSHLGKEGVLLARSLLWKKPSS